MAELRKEKRELTKARQLLHRSGCKGTAADKANSRRWFEVMREHSRLRRVLALRAGTKVSSHELARFKRDPMKFGKQLFEKKLSGDPTFTSDAGFDYLASCTPAIAGRPCVGDAGDENRGSALFPAIGAASHCERDFERDQVEEQWRCPWSRWPVVSHTSAVRVCSLF